MYHTLRSCQTPLLAHIDLAIIVNSVVPPSSLTTILLSYTTRFPAHSHPASPPSSSPSPAPSSSSSPSPSSSPSFSPSPGRNVTFFSTSPSPLLPLLQRYVDFSAQFDFAGVERHYRPLLTDLLTWRMQQPHLPPISITQEYDPCGHYAYTSPLPPPPTPPPPSINLSPLPADPATSALIASHWPYSSPTTSPLVHALLTHLDNSVGAWRDGDGGEKGRGEVVGWVVRQLYGAYGMVHVMKEERGKGVGRAMVREVVRRDLEWRKREGGGGLREQVDVDGVFCYINDDNVASQRLFASVGFTRLFDVDWVCCTPNPAAPSDCTADG